MATGAYIANGRTLGDLQGKLTCHEHNGSSTVDYAVVSEHMNKYIKKFQVLDPSVGSDHCPIELEIVMTPNTNTHKNKTKTPTQQLTPTRWNDVTKQEFTARINSVETKQKAEEISKLLDNPNAEMDSVVDKICDIYTTKHKKHNRKPAKNNKKHTKKWYDKSCHELSKKLQLDAKLLAKFPKDPYIRGSFCKTRKEYKKLLNLKKKEWRSEMVQTLEELETKDPKEYWKLVNELREKKQNETSFDADSFTIFFERLYSAPESKEKHIKLEKYVTEILDTNKNLIITPNFTMKELLDAIKLLKNSKAAGPDRIIAEMLKASPENVLILLLKLMNKIKTNFTYPSQWGMGITSLLFKEGDDDDPNNYRAITVTDALSKVLAIMMNERIGEWSTRNSIKAKEQIGFEKKTRPADHLFVLRTLVDSYKSQGKKLYACFVDFQKAFDSVWRTGLIYKLIKYGMNMDMIKLIRNMYEKTSQCLKINQNLTRSFKTYRGVRQGCILSPQLFNLFINDIPNIFDDACKPITIKNKKISCLMYADDLVILSETPSGLQTSLDNLHKYTEKWDLKLNIKKTKVMIFQNQGRKKANTYLFGKQTIQTTDSYKYLGTIVTSTGNFKLNEVNLKRKGLRASYIISKNIGPLSKASTSIRLFEKIIEPILLYNSEVTGAYIPKSWNYEKFMNKMWDTGNELNKVVIGFLRQILGVHKKTTNLAIMAETGKYPIALKIFDQMLKYWYRISDSDNILLIETKELNNELHNRNKQCWKTVITYIMKALNITNTPNHDEHEKIQRKSFKQELQKKYDLWWKSQAQSTGENKLDFYYQHKKTFTYETYLDNIPRHIRMYITRLRLSSHSLPIEVLRYKYTGQKKKIDRENRKCTICNLGETGDENHYLTTCTNGELDSIRKKFMKNIREEIPQFKQFTDKNIIEYCMLLKDPTIQKPISIYVKDILQTYKDETEGTMHVKNSPIKTRTGRISRKPTKLNL